VNSLRGARQRPPGSPMRTSPILEDQHWSPPSDWRSFKLPAASRERIYEEGGTECDFFRTSCTRTEQRSSSDSMPPGRWPSLPEWPELDPAAFERGKALLGSMEMDPTCFSRDTLCHLALEIFEARGLPDELAADVGRVRRFILAVRESMYDNAYHNFYHVFDVTQAARPLNPKP
jgi:hypothetical protein